MLLHKKKFWLGYDCISIGNELDCKMVHHTIAKITFINSYLACWLFNMGLTITSAKNRLCSLLFQLKTKVLLQTEKVMTF